MKLNADFIDRYSRLDSPLHRAPAGLKLLAAVGLLVLIVTLPAQHAWGLGIIALALAALAALSRVPKWFLVKRLALLMPFMAVFASMALFQPHGGLPLFGMLLARGSLCLATVILLSNTTPFPRIVRAMRAARVPALLVTTLALSYRYLFVLADESQRMQRARLSRTFVAGKVRTWRSLSAILARLFIRSSERAERIYAAMCARGWR